MGFSVVSGCVAGGSASTSGVRYKTHQVRCREHTFCIVIALRANAHAARPMPRPTTSAHE